MCGVQVATHIADYEHSVNKDCVLVHAYFGQSLPKYVKKNLKLLRKTFPEKRIALITNIENEDSFLKKLQIELSKFELYAERDNYFNSNLKRDVGFRNDFWYTSLIRLIAVCDWQRKNHVPVLHIESDVIILPDFPFSKLESLAGEIAFPKSKPDLGVASVVFIRNAEASNKVIDFCEKSIAEDEVLNDMSFLGKLSNQKDLLNVTILPTIPRKVILENQLNHDSDQHMMKISSLSDYFGGCFDAAAFGQYFLGDDPRNNRGRKRLFQNIYDFDLKLSGFRVRIIENSLIASNDKERFPLFCLHIHSKDLRAFSFGSLKILLLIRNIQCKLGVHSVLTYHVFKFWMNPIKHRIKLFLKKEISAFR
jgi:hypothetical protein